MIIIAESSVTREIEIAFYVTVLQWLYDDIVIKKSQYQAYNKKW